MQPRPTRRILASATLTMEALLVVFAVIVAANFSSVPTTTVIVVGAAAALACVVVAGLLRYSWAYGAGWVLQALIVLSGLVVPMMWFLGAVFVLLWWLALHYGAKAERIQAAFRDHEGLPPS